MVVPFSLPGAPVARVLGFTTTAEGLARAAALAARRRPGRAELFRGLDEDGHPVTWGFRMANGAGEPQIDVFFPNPFLTAADAIAESPDWSRLELWDDVRTTYAGAAADGRDTLGAGFGKFLEKEFAVKA